MPTPDYVPTAWVDNTTPVDQARMNHLESGVDVATDGVRALEAIPVVPTVVNGKWIKGVGGAMVWSDILQSDVSGLTAALAAKEATANKGVANGYASLDSGAKVPAAQLPAMSGGGVDYIGVWGSGITYKQGDVVNYNGIEYMAVNPSTGQTPPSTLPGGAGGMVTTLPASPVDGQEAILVDSLVSPTFSWRFRYVAAKATNKWVYLGGAPIYSEVLADQATSNATYLDLGTVGPAVTAPVAGLYVIEFGANFHYAGGSFSQMWMSYQVGATAAADADAITLVITAAFHGSFAQAVAKTLAAATAVTAKYRSAGVTAGFSQRWMRLTPRAVGG